MSAALQIRDDYAARRDQLRERIGELPGPRIWNADDLARFFRVTRSWVKNQCRRTSEDPPPRVAGMSCYGFDTWSVEFLIWLARRLRIDVSDMDNANPSITT